MRMVRQVVWVICTVESKYVVISMAVVLRGGVCYGSTIEGVLGHMRWSSRVVAVCRGVIGHLTVRKTGVGVWWSHAKWA